MASRSKIRQNLPRKFFRSFSPINMSISCTHTAYDSSVKQIPKIDSHSHRPEDKPACMNSRSVPITTFQLLAKYVI